MAGYNRIILIGNLTRDPEHKELASGQGVCRLGLATNRQFKNRQTGEMVQEVLFVDIDVWGPQAESCRQYLSKGRPVLVEGRLKLDTWQDQNGQNRSKHSVVADRVVFLGGSNEAGVAIEEQQEPKNELERELLDQIETIKKNAIKKQEAAMVQKPQVEPAKTVKSAPIKPQTVSTSEDDMSTGELNFNDQPPFQDDLPF
ncbi:MAG TPA: single-stranded DNA-binding protein [Candidatus Dependentiae bacterium]|nr:single-stranded DNA-binding protein [Candidatus Dependentiae bacterium]HRQ62565.1 single-stranded DNA-binding protein [Candidatus Dependentiae bacterium]